MHSIRFPNETPGYRQARNQLLEAERDLRRNVEQVAAMRRQLPLGGEVREDYVFHEFSGPGDPVRPVRLSELFDPAKNTLEIYLLRGTAYELSVAGGDEGIVTSPTLTELTFAASRLFRE